MFLQRTDLQESAKMIKCNPRHERDGSQIQTQRQRDRQSQIQTQRQTDRDRDGDIDRQTETEGYDFMMDHRAWGL